MSIAYRRLWIARVCADQALSADATAVAEVLGPMGVIGRVASTDWQRVNIALGRPRRDQAVLRQIEELQRAGYLGRRQGNQYHQSRGWRLTLPEEAPQPAEADEEMEHRGR